MQTADPREIDTCRVGYDLHDPVGRRGSVEQLKNLDIFLVNPGQDVGQHRRVVAAMTVIAHDCSDLHPAGPAVADVAVAVVQSSGSGLDADHLQMEIHVG